METSGASLSSCRRSADAACADSRQRSRRVFFDLLSELLQRRRLLGSWRGHRQCGGGRGAVGGWAGTVVRARAGARSVHVPLTVGARAAGVAHVLLVPGQRGSAEPPEDQYYGDDPDALGVGPLSGQRGSGRARLVAGGRSSAGVLDRRAASAGATPCRSRSSRSARRQVVTQRAVDHATADVAVGRTGGLASCGGRGVDPRHRLGHGNGRAAPPHVGSGHRRRSRHL